MSNASITLWFNEVFWPSYNALMKCPFATKWKSGARGEALKKILTMQPSMKLQERIAAALVAQRRHRTALGEQCGSMHGYLQATKFNKFYANRMCSTWINQMGWEDEIPVLEVKSESTVVMFDGARCQHDGCVMPIHGPSYIYCAEHESRTAKSNGELKDSLKKLGLEKYKSETFYEYAMRCKEVGMNLLKRLGNGM